MGINLRTQQLKKGRLRLSLDIYANGKSRYENLKLFLYEKPTTPAEREHNKRTKSLADSIMAKRILEMQEGNYNVVTGFKSQASFVNYFKQLTNDRRYSESNYGNWSSAYKHLVGYTKGRDITFAEVNEDFLNGFKKYLLTGKVTKGNQNLSECSASSYLNKVKAALNQAFIDRIITYNPGKVVKGIKVPDNARQFLVAEELRKLKDTPCAIPVLKDAFLFSCITGLRWSDINKLTWREIVYSEEEDIHKIHFKQKKTKDYQYHPITEAACRLLGKRGKDDDRVFKGLKYSAWHNYRLGQWIMDAGISKKITFHCGRHTYATLILASGGEIYTLSSLLGHKCIKTTQVYGKIVNPIKNKTVEMLPDIGI